MLTSFVLGPVPDADTWTVRLANSTRSRLEFTKENTMLREFYFTWTCPECHHVQVDGFNVEQGPYLSLTCGECEHSYGAKHLSREDAQAWAQANAKEEYHIVESVGCGSYFADMVRTVIAEARKEVADLRDVRVRS
jgi:hypothetical protein